MNEFRIHFALIRPTSVDRDNARVLRHPLASDNRIRRVRCKHDYIGTPHCLLGALRRP